MLHFQIRILSDLKHHLLSTGSCTSVSAGVIAISGKAAAIAFEKRRVTLEIRDIPSTISAIVFFAFLRFHEQKKNAVIFGGLLGMVLGVMRSGVDLNGVLTKKNNTSWVC